VADARRIIDISRDAGINLLDTANVYSTGSRREAIGEALEGGRRT
jgi:aryl-alcohol dehydrogenase-like predicted oxidoreductase